MPASAHAATSGSPWPTYGPTVESTTWVRAASSARATGSAESATISSTPERRPRPARRAPARAWPGCGRPAPSAGRSGACRARYVGGQPAGEAGRPEEHDVELAAVGHDSSSTVAVAPGEPAPRRTVGASRAPARPDPDSPSPPSARSAPPSPAGRLVRLGRPDCRRRRAGRRSTAATPATSGWSTRTSGRRRPATSCCGWYVDRGVDRVTPYGWDYLRVYAMADAAGSPEAPQPRWAAGRRRRPATPAPTSRRPASTSPTWSRPTARCSCGSSTTAPWSSTTSPAPSRSAARVRCPLDAMARRAAARRRPRRGDRPGPRRPRRGRVDAGHPGARRRRGRPERAHGRARVGVRLDARHRARQHGDVVRLVVSTGLPDLDFAQPGFFRRRGRRRCEKNQERRRGPAPSTTGCRTSRRPAPTARNASSSSGATTSRSRPPTPGSARSRWSASTCTTRRPPTPRR